MDRRGGTEGETVAGIQRQLRVSGATVLRIVSGTCLKQSPNYKWLLYASLSRVTPQIEDREGLSTPLLTYLVSFPRIPGEGLSVYCLLVGKASHGHLD